MLWARNFRRERACNTKHEGVEHMIDGDAALLPPQTIPVNINSFRLEMRSRLLGRYGSGFVSISLEVRVSAFT